MPRAVPTALSNLLADVRTESFSSLVLNYSDSGSTVKRLATRTHTDEDDNDYLPLLKSVGELRFTLGATVDRVSCSLFNNDNVLGLEVASELRYFGRSKATLGRFYQNPVLTDVYHSTLFVGAVINARVTSREVKIDIIDSLVAAGQIIAARTLIEHCSYKFKDPATCGSTDAGRSSCNKILNSTGGCSSDATSGQKNRFGGWFFPYQRSSSPPTTGGGGVDGGGGTTCFTAKTRILMADRTEKPISKIRKGDEVVCFYWDEELRRDVVTVRKVKRVFRHRSQGVFEFKFSNGRSLNLTPEHPLYRGKGAFFIADWAKCGQKYKSLERNTDFDFTDVSLEEMRWCNEAQIKGEYFTTYNFEVEDCHTYIANGIPVHNKPDPNEL